MPVKFENFEYWYWNEQKKPVFVPNARGYDIGYRIKNLVEKRVAFDDFYFHLQKGGHVAALHKHRHNKWFARADLKDFFYSIARNRVARVLREIGLPKAALHAKFSCVKNPYGDPSYCLPYGFVQSPILSTLVVSKSVLGSFLNDLDGEVTVSVYMDDIAISSACRAALESVFLDLLAKIEEANFRVNQLKTTPPCEIMELFKCSIEQDWTAVTENRKSEFFSRKRTSRSKAGFERYCESVEAGNAPEK